MDYDTKVFPHTGGYGRYNRVVVVFCWFPSFAVALNLFSDVFYTLIPDSYHCKPDPQLLPSAFLLSNLSKQEYLHLVFPWENGTGRSHCELYKYPPNASDLSQHVRREKVACTRGWEYSQVAGLQSNFVTESLLVTLIRCVQSISSWMNQLTHLFKVISRESWKTSRDTGPRGLEFDTPVWNLVCSDYWKIPLQHICFMTGWILGYILLGSLCDWLGRRRAFLLSVSLSSLLGVAACLSGSAVVFLLLRLSQGATLAGVFVSSYIVRLELCDPSHRLMVAMVGGFFGVFAELLLPGFAALCRDWPVLQAVVTLPLLLLLSYWCCASVFPESPRWLLATDQIPQVKRSLQEFSTRNGVCLQDEVYPGESLMSEINSAYGDDHRPRFYSVLELRQTCVIWKNCLILSFTMFIGTGIQYCFTRNLHVFSTNFYFSYFVRVATGALGCVFICLSVNHFGRRGMLLLSAIITGLASLLLLALTQYLHGGLVLVLSVVGLLFSQALAMLSVFFASEVMPTVVRGGCLGLVLAAGSVGMAASSLMELQNNGGHFLHHVVFASFAILSVLCVMLLPESKRKHLPDSLEEGESQRRPPLFLARPDRDGLRLLRARPASPEYNPENYSLLVSATRKMLTKDRLPYQSDAAAQAPLLSDGGARGPERHTLTQAASERG